MTSRQIPNFLKRAAKRDANPTPISSTSSSASAGASRSIRFSSLGASDYDFMETPPSSSQLSHPLEPLPDSEEPAEEALHADFAPTESLVAAEAPFVLARPPSVSAPPEMIVPVVSMEEKEADDDVKVEPEEPPPPSVDNTKRPENTKSPPPLESIDLLDDIDKTFDSVPKPAQKPRRPPSAYAKSRPKATSVKTVTSSGSSAEALCSVEVEEEASGVEVSDKTGSQASSVAGAASESIFDRDDPVIDAGFSLLSHATADGEKADSAPVGSVEKPSSPTMKTARERNFSPSSSVSGGLSERIATTVAPPSPLLPSTQGVTQSPSDPPTFSTSSTPPSTPVSPQEPQAAPSILQVGNVDLQTILFDKRFVAAAAVAFSALCLRVLPSASFIIGFIWGSMVTLGLTYLYRLLNTRTAPRERFQSVPELRDLPPPNIPHVADEPDDSGGIFRGWLNELNVYVPESYHINQTSSVFVSLDGTQLRIQRPKASVQKRAMWNEVLPSGSAGAIAFIHQRHFEMMGAKVSLEPGGLVRKRVWSKKYPICIEVATGNAVGAASSASRSSKSSSRRSAADDFEWVDEREATSERIYLFARTCREKEEWYRRFEAATKGKPLQLSLKRIINTHLEDDRSSTFAACNPGGGGSSGDLSASASTVSFSSLSSSGSQNANVDVAVEAASLPAGAPSQWSDRLTGSEREPLSVTYTRYMARFMPAEWLEKAAKTHRLSVNYIACDPEVLWLNAILGRGVWDFLREKIWADKVKQKIQNKLRKIHYEDAKLPYFIDELSVVEISLGKDFPVIRRAGKPFLDRRGLWVELDIAYCGGSSMALETKVNLMKLRRPRPEGSGDQKASTEGSGAMQMTPTTTGGRTNSGADGGTTPGGAVGGTTNRKGQHHSRTGAFCSEEEDSAESTTDSELDENPEADIVTDPDKGNHVGGGTSRKLLRFVDRISRSSYFHKAIENKFIQRGMEYVSNTRIVLHVEVRGLSGKLLVNIPPPPTDRLWYGFKPCPKLILAARPKVGAKELTMNRLTEWIEKKLELEFQRIFVLPNMDDLVVPLLLSGNPENSGHTETAAYSKS